MISINELSKEVLLLDCKIGPSDRNETILGIHEAASKLWTEIKNGSNKEDLEKRVANVLIGGLVTARMMGMIDIEDLLRKRVDQLKNDLV